MPESDYSSAFGPYKSRATVSTPTPKEEGGITLEGIAEHVAGTTGLGAFNALFQGGVAAASDYQVDFFKNLLSHKLPTGSPDQDDRDRRRLGRFDGGLGDVDPLADVVGAFIGGGVPGVQAQLSPESPNDVVDRAVARDAAAQSEIGQLTSDIVKENEEIDYLLKQNPKFMNAEQAQEHAQAIQAHEELIKGYNDEITALQSVQSDREESHQIGNMLLEAAGLPASISAARADPEVAAVLDLVDDAVQSGNTEDLDAALDALQVLEDNQEGVLDDLGQAYRRDRYFDNLGSQVKIQVHNLIENRQLTEDAFLEYEDFMIKELEAQQLDLWQTQADPTPEGRGMDAITNHMEPIMERSFRGIMSSEQWKFAAETFDAIWMGIPQEPLLDEEGEEVSPVDENGNIVPQAFESNLPAPAVLALQDLGTFFGFSQSQTQEMITEMERALVLGKEARVLAAEWKNLNRLRPGKVELGTAIAEVSLEIYDDPEMAEEMAVGHLMHRIIKTRNPNGNITNYDESASGNQFGLGNLPMHTYEELGYSAEMLEDNPEVQLEALMHFIGRKYNGSGDAMDGLRAALSDLKHNPGSWGDIPSFSDLGRDAFTIPPGSDE